MAPILDATLIPSKLRGPGLAVLFVSVAASARAQTYTVIDLGTLPGGNSSYTNGINNRGEVVGYSSCFGDCVRDRAPRNHRRHPAMIGNVNPEKLAVISFFKLYLSYLIAFNTRDLVHWIQMK